MGAGHSHDHDDFVDWKTGAADPGIRAVFAAVFLTGIATIIALFVLWPTGDGQREAVSNAADLGLVTERFTATVYDIVDAPCSYADPEDLQQCRSLAFLLNEGPDAGAIVALPEANLQFERSASRLQIDDAVVVGYESSTAYYFYADQDRRVSLLWLAALFVVVVLALGRIRGVFALVAMAATLLVLVGFVAPSVLDGNDPLLVSVVAASVIAFVSLYLTHGFSPTTTVALAGTLAALGLTLGLSWWFFRLARFTGLASEEAFVLPVISEGLDLRGLLLGGAIIGALGALDDVTVTQVATVAEIRRRSPDLPTAELISSGIRVGRDHIASTVNTLLLAYAGASMPLLLVFAVSDQSLEMIANSELIAVEIVRTLCGSIGLVAAVPLTTTLAAAVLRPSIASAERSGHPQADQGSHVDPIATEPPQAATPTPPNVTGEARWEDFAPQED